MKILFSIFVTVCFFTYCSNCFSQSEIDLKAWSEYTTPGTVHEMLAKSDGEWTEAITFWTDPNGQPMKSTAKVVNKMILGGRYQYSVSSGDMMGMPFEGIKIIGYDNARKIFQSTWIDIFGTGTSFS